MSATAELEALRAHVQAAGGLMPMASYERLHRLGRETSARRAVEIGAAHGASAIALARGAAAAETPLRITTVDPMGGAVSSRTKFGSPETNRDILLANVEKAGVANRVRLVLGTSATYAAERGDDGPIELLLLDADGRLDRDLIALHEHLSSECALVVDDVGLGARLHETKDGYRIDLKHEISRRLVDGLVEDGALEPVDQVCELFFGHLRTHKLSVDRLKEIALHAYRELVFQSVERSTMEAWAQRDAAFEETVRLGRFVGTIGRPALQAYRALRGVFRA